MARATTKADLINSANKQFDKMWKLIETMSDEQQQATFSENIAMAGKETHWSRDRNVRMASVAVRMGTGQQSR